MEALRSQVQDLLNNKLYESAEILGSFLISASGMVPQSVSSLQRAENTMLYGDALYGKQEYRRALHHYQQALQLLTSLSVSFVPFTTVVPEQTAKQAEVKTRMAQCLVELTDHRAALAELESIHAAARSITVWAMMARLYRLLGFHRAALATYKECLRRCPYAVEALVALADLGVSDAELKQLLRQATPTVREDAPDNGMPNTDAATSKPDVTQQPPHWLISLASGHVALASQQPAAALREFGGLAESFPDNVHLLGVSAAAQAGRGDSAAAVGVFQRLRIVDPYVMAQMDLYALLLKERGNLGELGKLAHDLLAIDARRPEVWGTAAAFWESKQLTHKALEYVERGLVLNDRRQLLHIIHGRLLVRNGQPHQALSAFRQAKLISPDIISYTGMVDAAIAAELHKEAMFAAREAVKVTSGSARALTLLGRVHVRWPASGTQDTHRKYFDSALQKDPHCLEALVELVDLHVKAHRYLEALELLREQLSLQSSDELHAKLARVYHTIGDYDEALTHYQAALGHNPHHVDALQGLQSLELIMTVALPGEVGHGLSLGDTYYDEDERSQDRELEDDDMGDGDVPYSSAMGEYVGD